MIGRDDLVPLYLASAPENTGIAKGQYASRAESALSTPLERG
jgi:hypothetical protein